MQDITRLVISAKRAAKVRSSSALPDMPSIRPSRRSEATAFIISKKLPAMASSRLIILNASPIFLALANIAAVISPSGNMMYAAYIMLLLSVLPSVCASNAVILKPQAQNTADKKLTTSIEVLQRNLRTPSEGDMILL